MEYSLEMLNKIEELANSLTSPEDIARIIEVDSSAFYSDLREQGTLLYKSFYRGYLQKKLEIKQKNLLPLDVDSEDFTLIQLKDFESKLIIQLHG